MRLASVRFPSLAAGAILSAAACAGLLGSRSGSQPSPLDAGVLRANQAPIVGLPDVLGVRYPPRQAGAGPRLVRLRVGSAGRAAKRRMVPRHARIPRSRCGGWCLRPARLRVLRQSLVLVFAQVVPSAPGSHERLLLRLPDSRMTATGARSGTIQGLADAIVACNRCPRLRAHCREIARVRKRAFADEEYWGAPGARAGRPERPAPHHRARPRGARRQPHRPALHRRLQRELALRGAAPLRLGQPAQLAPARRRPGADRLPHHRRRPLRPAGQPPHARGAGQLPPVSRRRAAPAAQRPGRARARPDRVGELAHAPPAGGSGSGPASVRRSRTARRRRCRTGCCWSPRSTRAARTPTPGS